MGFDSIVFDLDGTLWDTCQACAVAWNNVLERNGIAFRRIEAGDVRKVTGKPHEACISETFIGLTEKQIQIITNETITEDNVVVGRLGGDIYPGVSDGLRELSKNHRLFIVSNCQSGYIETFLKFSKFESLFEDFECWGNTKKSKAENLAKVIERNSLARPVMVGDMESDLFAARNCKVPFIHMRYGFGDVSSSNWSFDSFSQLTEFFNQYTK
jgi:phosphoglycolate phosphatase